MAMSHSPGRKCFTLNSDIDFLFLALLEGNHRTVATVNPPISEALLKYFFI